MAERSHYDTLQIAKDAGPDVVREAYRRLARIHHPDAAGGSAQEMAALNEAWRVLADPARRAAYDRGTTLSTGATRTAATSDRLQTDLYPTAPRLAHPTFPWKWFAVGGPFVVIAVLVLGAVFGSDAPAPVVDQLIEAGSCIKFEPNGDAFEVLCDGTQDANAVRLIAYDETCDQGLVQHRDRQGRGWVCVEP